MNRIFVGLVAGLAVSTGTAFYLLHSPTVHKAERASIATTTSTTLPRPTTTTPPSTTTTPAPLGVLSPALVGPASGVSECAQQLTVGADGNVEPLECADGGLNVTAWRYFVGTNPPSVMVLGSNATSAQVESAMCADLHHSTGPIESSAEHLAATYYDWTFSTDPTLDFPMYCQEGAVPTTTPGSSYATLLAQCEATYPVDIQQINEQFQQSLGRNATQAEVQQIVATICAQQVTNQLQSGQHG